MALHKLVFDATDADTRAASANVGAYLRSADGTLLTHTDVGGKKALDVRVAEGINVEVDLDAADDSVAAWLSDGAGNAISSTGGALHISDGGGSLTVDGTVTALQGTSPWVVGDGGGSLTVDAVDLDIRDLTQADEVTVFQGTDPWIVSATDLDIRDLDAAQDSVAAWLSDGSGNAISSTGGSLNVNVTNTITTSDAALANSALKAVAETVGTSAAAIVDGADELASRKYLYLYNNGNRMAYLGESGVTVSSGFPLAPGSILEARIGAAVDVYMIADAAAQNVRTLQLS